MKKSKQKTALISGASGGIGQAIARQLARDGFYTVLGYHQNKAAAESLAKELCGEAVRLSLTTAEEIDASCEVVKKSGADVLVNNAGESLFELLIDMSPKSVRKLLAVNLESGILLSQAALYNMLSEGWGRIVSIGSIYGTIGSACESVYSAAKAGLIGFTKSLASEVGASGITVNAIAPGAVDTPMNARLSDAERSEVVEATPLRRFGTPQDVANAVSFLVSDNAAFITGEVLTVSGGFLK